MVRVWQKEHPNMVKPLARCLLKKGISILSWHIKWNRGSAIACMSLAQLAFSFILQLPYRPVSSSQCLAILEMFPLFLVIWLGLLVLWFYPGIYWVYFPVRGSSVKWVTYNRGYKCDHFATGRNGWNTFTLQYCHINNGNTYRLSIINNGNTYRLTRIILIH